VRARAAQYRRLVQLARVVQDVRARTGGMDPAHFDLLLALAVAGALQLELALRPLGDDRVLAHAVGLVTFAGLLLRRRMPEACVVLVVGPAAYYQSIESLYDDGIMPFLTVLFATFAVGMYLEGRRLAGGLALSLAVGTLLAVTDPEGPPVGDFIGGLAIAVGAPALIGATLRQRARTADALGEKARRAEAGRARLIAEAVEGERNRIAGELHDVVAHALSAMVVQAGAARRLVATDPAAAGGAFSSVEHSGRDALTEIRSLLGVLRREDEELALAPQPSLAHVGSLVQRVRASGLPVTLSVEGERPALSAGADLTAFRVVQEALGEALAPGGAGAAEVRIQFSPAEVQVRVADDGPVPERALLGMRERVALYGGELSAGSRRGGGHVVRVRLPAGAAP
jgi:signal transduction histidine kinase